MTYTGDTPIVGQGTVTAASIDAWLAQIGRSLAPRYAPDGQYLPPPTGLGQAFITWCHHWPAAIVNYDLVVAQCAKETAGWQSYWAREANNPAGLGVTGVAGQGERFDTPSDGIECHVAHLLSYAVGRGEWVPHDCRAGGMPVGYWGSAPTWDGLNGKWAVPGTHYGQEIASLANDLVQFGATMPEAQVPGFAWVPDVGEYGYPQGTHGRNGRDIDRLIMHCTIGTDSLAWLTGEHGNSVHFLDHRNGTPRAQMVLLADAAWGAGNREYNLRGVNYEHEATGVEMLNPAYWTDSIIDNIAKNAANIIRACPKILPDREHVIGHAEVPNQDHTDPGPNFPWPRFMAALNRELGATPPRNALYIPGNPFGEIPIVAGFMDFVLSQGSHRYSQDVYAGILSLFGYPMHPEHPLPDGRSQQEFERTVLIWTPNTPVPWDVVLRLREGA